MTLLELLARELKEWPETDGEYGPIESMSQDADLQVSHYTGSRQVWREDINDWSGHGYVPCSRFTLPELATDHATAIVTRADWEAEKARIAGKADGGWIRHRVGKQPVADGVRVDYRMRNGRHGINERSELLDWGRSDESPKSDIMAFRIHKPAEQPEPVSEEAIQVGIDAADAGKLTPIAEVKARFTCEPVIYLEQMQEGMTVRFSRFTNPDHRHWEFTPGKEYRVGRIGDDVGPVADSGHIPSVNWGFEFTLVDCPLSDIREAVGSPQDTILLIRDRIRALDTQRAELEATYQRQVGEIDWERVELVRRLASEGLALVEVQVQPVEDMSDWRNWKAGDLLSYAKDSFGVYVNGDRYAIQSIKGESLVIDDKTGDKDHYWDADVVQSYFKWHSRPAS